MSRVAAKFVRRLLTQLQKNYRVEVAQDNLEMIRNNPEFLKKVITGDESGSTAMTLRQKLNLFSGRRQKNNDQRKRVKVGAMWRHCSLFFSTTKVLFNINTLHEVRRWTRSTTYKFWKDYEM